MNPGRPTYDEVQLLIERFGAPDGRCVIPYEDVEGALQYLVCWGTDRWRTVTDAWRRRLERDHGIVIRCLPGLAFEMTSSSGKIDVAGDKWVRGRNSINRSVRVARLSRQSELSDSEQRARDYYIAVGSKIVMNDQINQIIRARRSRVNKEVDHAKKGTEQKCTGSCPAPSQGWGDASDRGCRAEAMAKEVVGHDWQAEG